MSGHQTVLYEEALRELRIKPNGIYLDCTFGRGGHSRGILTRLGSAGRLLAMDRDHDAIVSAAADELKMDPRFSLHHACFSELAAVAERSGCHGKLDGILMDLGVSSPQLDNADRGFSFLRDGPLDMRMDSQSGPTAAEYLATVEEAELARIFYEYGEERYSRRIAKAIVAQRQSQPLTTTAQLARLIEDNLPFRDKHKHPATRCFQAIRIEINQELEQLRAALRLALAALAPEGRLVVISFHSLEDRIVKNFIRDEAGAKHDPGKLPVRERDIEQGRLRKIGKAIRAQSDELQANVRARSAILRVAEKR